MGEKRQDSGLLWWESDGEAGLLKMEAIEAIEAGLEKLGLPIYSADAATSR